MIFIKGLRDYVYITHHLVGLFGLIAVSVILKADKTDDILG